MSGQLRKSPQQERSRHMVDRIVEAGRRVLAEQGYERASTNRVAEEAGISPGSLYQYFPNKAAVLDAVIAQYSQEFSEQLASLVVPPVGPDPVATVRATFDGLIDALEANREYVRLIAEQLPRAQTGEQTGQVERRIRDLVGAYLVFAPSRERIAPAASAWILVRMVEHLTVQYVLESPDIPREQLVDELVRLTMAHLGSTK